MCHGVQGIKYVAVMGTGSAGMKHLAALTQLEGVRPIAIPQRQERRKQLEELGYLTAADLGQAVQAGATHCVVATDTGRHTKDCSTALDSGFHVLCEKPLAATAFQANELCCRALKAGRNLSVGCVLRFAESLNAFRQQLPNAGSLHSVRIEYQSYLPDWRPNRPYRQSYSARPNEGGVLLDLIHEIDYAGWLFGWPDSLQARLSNLGRLDIRVCELAELNWQTSKGCMVSIALDYLTRPPHRSIRAFGEQGSISWDWYSGKVELNKAGGSSQEWRLPQPVEDIFLAQAQAFVETGSGTDDPRIATGSEGTRALAVCDAARRSSEQKREEMVAYP